MHTCTRTHIGAASTRRNESRYIQSGRSNANSCEGYPIVFILEVVRDERGKTDTTKTRASSRSFSSNNLRTISFEASFLLRGSPFATIHRFSRTYVTLTMLRRLARSEDSAYAYFFSPHPTTRSKHDPSPLRRPGAIRSRRRTQPLNAVSPSLLSDSGSPTSTPSTRSYPASRYRSTLDSGEEGMDRI